MLISDIEGRISNVAHALACALPKAGLALPKDTIFYIAKRLWKRISDLMSEFKK